MIGGGLRRGGVMGGGGYSFVARLSHLTTLARARREGGGMGGLE